jgi:hypothetical protein
MHKWFECTIKYERQLEEGKIAKVTERYLVDALTFTEAETRIIEEMKPLISGEFEVANINPQKYSELFWNESGDKWFKTKVNFIVLDEEKGVEKKVANYMLVQANDLKESRELLVDGMKGSMADLEIASISETKILDVYKYI